MDWPHGLRKQSGDFDALGLGAPVPATCFPTVSVLANSRDEKLPSAVGLVTLLQPDTTVLSSQPCQNNSSGTGEFVHLSLFLVRIAGKLPKFVALSLRKSNDVIVQ